MQGKGEGLKHAQCSNIFRHHSEKINLAYHCSRTLFGSIKLVPSGDPRSKSRQTSQKVAD